MTLTYFTNQNLHTKNRDPNLVSVLKIEDAGLGETGYGWHHNLNFHRGVGMHLLYSSIFLRKTPVRDVGGMRSPSSS